MRKISITLGLVASMLLSGAAFAQSTRGAIMGIVADDAGAALPGVTVAVTSPALQSQKSAVTDAGGNFRVNVLPAGTYKVIFALPGFQTIEQSSIIVSIGSTARLDVTMKEAFGEEVLVTDNAPLVDVTSTTLGVNLTPDFFLDLPTGRNYTSVASIAPGAQSDGSGQTFYGSTGAENAYYIDGLNTTGVELGQQGKTLNFEFIQEVQVKTGGYGAEHGRSTGGQINVITKSGGNEFHGDLFGYWDADTLRDSLDGSPDADFTPAGGAASASRRTTEQDVTDFGFDIGGYFIQDKLWFFGAYDTVKDDRVVSVQDDFSEVGGPSFGDTFSDVTDSELYALKLTWNASPNHLFSGSFFGDPSERAGVGGRSLAAPETHYLGVDETGGDDWVLNYDGVLGENVVISGRYAQHEETATLTGPGENLIGFIDFSNPLGTGATLWGWDDNVAGYGFYQNQAFSRDQYNVDLAYFLNEVAGQHEFKAGFEFEEIGVQNSNTNSGGQRIYRFNCSPDDPSTPEAEGRYCGDNYEHQYYYRHRYYTYAGMDVINATTADVRDPLTVDTKSDNTAAFVQDRWQVNPNLSVNLGLRWEGQKLYNGDGGVQANINDNFAPRLGFVYDWEGTGKSKVFAHFGRFYETIPMDIVIRSFGGEVSVFSYNFSDDPNDVAASNPDDSTCANPHADTGCAPRGTRVLGGGFSNVDPDLGGQYIDEFVVGAEYEIMSNFSIGAKIIHRDLGEVIEDALSSDGDYFIGNPGSGILTDVYAISYYYGNYEAYAAPKGERTFKGLELTATKRFSNNYQFTASYLYSELEGNYDGTFQASTGQLDPNLNSAYDYFDFMVNNNGKLSNDRPHQFKIDGSYSFPMGLTVGLSTYFRSGTPITAMGYSSWYANWEYYLSERGAFGRTDSEYEADVHFGYPIKIGDYELNVLLDVFNLLNRQGETARSVRYNLDETFVPIPYDAPYTIAAPIAGGTDCATASAATGNDASACNPNFNRSSAWQAPRSMRVGLRFTF